MEPRDLRLLLENVSAGTVSPDAAFKEISLQSVATLDYATLDLERGMRQGVSEVIYGAGKTASQIAGIITSFIEHHQQRVLITRLDQDKASEVARLTLDLLPERMSFTYHSEAHLGTVGDAPAPDGLGYILVICAGTSDIPVAEEAALTAEMLGNRVERSYDVGVAGIHRLLAKQDTIAKANAIIAVAGMEGALASVVGGLAKCPVIAVPTSIGYGTAFGGITALLAMLNSCASGVSVVNIDNGFGAGYQASLINHPNK